MAKLNYLTEDARKAINRMPVCSEKDKRLLHVALDAVTKVAAESYVTLTTTQTISGDKTFTGTTHLGDVYWTGTDGVTSDLQVDGEGWFLNGDLTVPYAFGFGKVDANTPMLSFSGDTAITHDRTTYLTNWVVGALSAITIDGSGSVPNVGVGITPVDSVYNIVPMLMTHARSAVHNYSATASSDFYLCRSNHATKGSHTKVEEDDIVGWIAASGSDGVDFNGEIAGIAFKVDGPTGTDNVPGRIEFYTTQQGQRFVDATPAMTLNKFGHVVVHDQLRMGTETGPRWLSGTGSPEGVVVAGVGSLYTRTDGGAGTTLYIKEVGGTSTGWAAK